MPESIVSQNQQYFRLQQEVTDMRQRTLLGISFYLLAWLMCWGLSKQPMQILGLGLSLSALFAAMLGLRIVHRLPVIGEQEKLLRWRRQHWFLLHGSALLWGYAASLPLTVPSLENVQLISVMATIAFSTAASFNFPMQRWSAAILLLFIYLPSLALMLPKPALHVELLVPSVLFLLSQLLALKRNNAAYHRGIDLQLQLQEQREQLDRMSRTDSLTQLGNRLEYSKLFPLLVAQARRSRQPLAFLLMDIDHFKQVNDRFGHMAGDECLRQFAEHMRQVFRRDSDILLRLGGEEFGVLMPGCPLEQARAQGESFRTQLEQTDIQVQGTTLRITTSLGLGVLDELDELDQGNADAFFNRVDAALYQAKHMGRNRLHEA